MTRSDTKSSGGNRIDAVLADRPAGLWPFLAAGFPDVDTTGKILKALDALPIRGIELGFPFSDPIADGPIIQHAFSQALNHGIRVREIFDMVQEIRGDVRHPILAMVSASIVYRIGVESFVSQAAEAGFDGLIVPDISLEEAPQLSHSVAQAGMRLSMLIAPTTPSERERKIAELSSGFLYYVSVQGTTGERKALAADLPDHVKRLQDATGLPVIVGFGLSTPEQVREVCGFANGGIVGSAIVRRIGKAIEADLSSGDLVADVVEFIRELACE